MNVFIGLTEIAGFYSQISKYLIESGFKCDFLDLSNNPYKYETHPAAKGGMIKVAEFLVYGVRKYRSSLFFLLIFILASLIFFPVFFVFILLKNDVFVFASKTSFFRFVDLPLMLLARIFGKRIVVLFHGSDARPPYLNGVHQIDVESAELKKLFKKTKRCKQDLGFIEKLADTVVCGPSISAFLEKDYVNFNYLGLPIDVADHPKKDFFKDDSIHIIHAPSRLASKGTNEIERIVKKLRDEFNIKYKRLHSVPNKLVRAELYRADLVLDQYYSDYPLAGLATEAASIGVCSVSSGYNADDYIRDFPSGGLPPSIYVKPELLETTLRELFANRERIIKLGNDSYEYVKNNRDYREVGQRFVSILNNTVQENYFLSPHSFCCYKGWGLSLEKRNLYVGALIRKYSEGSLFLEDKPNVRCSMINDVKSS